MLASQQRPRATAILAGAILALTLLISGFALIISHSQRDAHRALSDRFANRAGLTAQFARAYVDDIARQERRQAERLLGTDSDQKHFEQVVNGFDFDAAVLVDDTGHLLQVWPAKPEIIGEEMTTKYAHLRAAVQGTVGVSELVPSAAKGLPIAAIAVPFNTPAGRRVLSGAFTPADSPLGSYLASINFLHGSNSYLVDRAGHVLAAGHEDSNAESALQHAHIGMQSARTVEGSLTIAVAEVSGTPWRVMLTAPTDVLYAPAAKGRWAPWALLAVLALIGAIAILLFLRLSRARLLAISTARTDALTGLANRRAMEEHLEQLAAQAGRQGQKLVALMVDLDHFKTINDRHGHEGGDVVLRQVAQGLRNALRAGDIAGRWGGEEFLILLPNTDDVGGLIVAERIRHAIIQDDSLSPGIPVTASIGLAVLDGDTGALLRDADRALYEAKAAGRNRTVVVVAPLPSFEPHLVAP
jgi:diguanylate cyclase (GGDEF)-like protein